MLIYTIIKYLVKFLIFLKNNILNILFNKIIFIIFKNFFLMFLSKINYIIINYSIQKYF